MTFRAWVLMSGLTMCAAAAHAEPLEALLPQVVKSHPKISAARSNADAALYGEKEAFAGYLPKVDVRASSGYETLDRTETRPAGRESHYPTDSVGVTVTQPLFNGFRTPSEVKSAKLNTELTHLTTEQTTQDVLLEAVTAYLEVMRQQELVDLAGDNMKTLKTQLHLEDERVQRGSGIAVDVLQAKSRLQISTERYTAFSGALQDAVSRYTQVYGAPPAPSTMRLPDLPPLPASLEEAVTIASKANPQLASTKASAAIARSNKQTAGAGYYPQVDLVGEAHYDDNREGVSGSEDGYVVKVQASWQVFSGFADKARVEKAQRQVNAAVDTEADARRQVDQEVKLAWSAMETTRKRAELLGNAVNIAGEVYDARTRLRDVGSDTALNVLDAENELYRARIEATAAKFDYRVSVYRLLKAMGRLSPETATGRTQVAGK